MRVWVAVSCLFCTLAAAQDSIEAPNIIVAMTDDHARWAMGAYGLDAIETPNLDWLASEGVQFTNAFSPAPVCSPARASFHTGKLPSQHGVHDFLSELPEFDHDWLSGEILLSEKLRDAGYRTALFGKWHATTDSRVPQRGFDRWLSYDPYRDGWQNQYRHSGTVYFSSDGEPVAYPGIQAHYLTDHAVAFIDDDDEDARPFFVSLNFTEPHWPFEGLPERLVRKYRAVAGSIVRAGGYSDLEARAESFTVPDGHLEKLAQYLAAVSLIDEQIGRLLDALSARGLMENTLLVFTSDHGLLMGQYGLYGKTNTTRPFNFYEETIRIPLLVIGPSHLVKPRQTRDELVDLLDLHATILDFAGAATTDAESLPGRSFRGPLTGVRDATWRAIQFAERGNVRMAFDGQWKLVREYPREASEMPIDRWFDVSHPRGETTSRLPPRRELREHLSSALETYFEKYESAELSGRSMWQQPAPNARVKQELANGR